jgi:tRNA (uracil-5-)-methyltransferase TRM9
MDQELKEKLLRINRTFYADFASHFSATRHPFQPGLERILPYVPDFCRLLDVGCGNGRLALWLEKKQKKVEYLGIDSAMELLNFARKSTERTEFVKARFLQLDVTQEDWASRLPSREFDVVAMISVLHHVPSYELRLRIFRDVADLLPKGGVFLLTTWQFLTSQRMRKKIVPWDVVGIDASKVEEGDYLLDWRGGGLGYRYCHFIDEGELSKLAREAGFRVLETFYADGKEGNLNLYGILVKRN